MAIPKVKPPAEKKIKLVIFPGEITLAVTMVDKDNKPIHRTVARGSIYVVNGHGESYPMMGGPPPGYGYNDVGGHTADPTPAGHFVLDKAEHVVTSSWPRSVIPWGAKLRETDTRPVEVQYQVGTQWRTATGRHGTVSRALYQFSLRSGHRRSFNDADAEARSYFYKSNGALYPVWVFNDFGPTGWCLKKHGERSPYFIHTTPGNEISNGLHKPVLLSASHGCIHIFPSHRDEMVNKGYLKQGVPVEIRKYGETGPPR